jgi:probable F420-dependent oxidoreductase
MKFGLLLPNYGPTASADILKKSAQLAEELEFDSIWTTDHILVPKIQYIPYGNIIESIVALSIAATVTSRIKLGTSLIIIPQREPILLAKQLAAIDFISDGRLIFGAGVGWMEEEFRFLGANFHQRGKIFDEYIAAIRSLWSGNTEFQGDFVSFQNAIFFPLPKQGPEIPIWIGGNSEKAIQRAAKYASAWHPVGLNPHEFLEWMSVLKSASANHPVMATLRAMVEFPGVGGIKQQVNELTLSRSFVFRGNLAKMRQSMVEFQEAGLEYIILWFFHNNWDELEQSVSTFAREVIPSFR